MKYRLFGALILSVVMACSSSDSTTPPPTSESLFDPLPAATPNKLRGVWTYDSQVANIELRIRFIESYAVGAAKCSPPGGTPVIIGKAIGLDTNSLDAQQGTFTMGQLVFGNATCQAGLQNSGTFNFTIDGTKLTVTLTGAQGALTFTKDGD